MASRPAPWPFRFVSPRERRPTQSKPCSSQSARNPMYNSPRRSARSRGGGDGPPERPLETRRRRVDVGGQTAKRPARGRASAGEPEREAAYFAPLVATPLMATRPSYGLNASLASEA